MPRPRVLVVDDEEGMLEVCQETLERLGEDVEVVVERHSARAVERLKDEAFDVMVTDIRMPGVDGVTLLRKAREHDPDLPVLMITGFPTIETAVECLRLGAVDYLTKPFLPDDLLSNVKRFLQERRLKDENRLLRRQVSRDYAFDDLVGGSPSMEAVFETVRRVADTDVDVLVVGETGTGKELVARAIHRRSRRGNERFIPVDCGAIPEHLLESEFFGYEKGAFTGANNRSIGLLEFADKGTFFLDEVGELPPLLQAKLLRALQERRIRRVGSKTETPVSVRVVAATGRDLDKMVGDGSFRQDLLYRINVVKIQLPPLRERGDDVLKLAQHFVQRHAREMGKNIKGIRPDALEVLAHYRWPGNVRELQNVIRRGIAMTRADEIGVEDLPDTLVVAAGDGAARLASTAAAGAAGAASAALGAGGGFFEERARRMSAFEREYLAAMLEQHQGDVTTAAKDAGIPRGTYYRLMKNHGLKANDFRG
ncbi:MAG: sigma-54-dependent Fis family transcriptional regulator [Planctomycetes bacterium]|nr:sigma-54-dependent Fis family transcriptional regulator [Planctomycetota bacterium]